MNVHNCLHRSLHYARTWHIHRSRSVAPRLFQRCCRPSCAAKATWAAQKYGCWFHCIHFLNRRQASTCVVPPGCRTLGERPQTRPFGPYEFRRSEDDLPQRCLRTCSPHLELWNGVCKQIRALAGPNHCPKRMEHTRRASTFRWTSCGRRVKSRMPTPLRARIWRPSCRSSTGMSPPAKRRSLR